MKIGCKLDLPVSLYSQKVCLWAHNHGYWACIIANKQWLDWSASHFNEGIKLNELTIKTEMFCTFLGEPEFKNMFNSFIEQWMSTTERGANTCMIMLIWKISLISMHLDCLLNFTKASWMMIRKNLPKIIWKCRRQELCHCYTISVAWQPGICFNSKGSVYKKHQCFSRF